MSGAAAVRTGRGTKWLIGAVDMTHRRSSLQLVGIPVLCRTFRDILCNRDMIDLASLSLEGFRCFCSFMMYVDFVLRVCAFLAQ